MAPERAKVFVAEDDSAWQLIIKKGLERSGHEVVVTATDLESALALVDQLESLGVDVAVLDGNLNKYESSGRDGQALLHAIRTKCPKVKTVGMSALSVPGSDLDLGKSGCHKIGEAVNNL